MAKGLLLFRRAEHPSVTAYTYGRLLALAPSVALLRGVDLIPFHLKNKWLNFSQRRAGACETP
jgi:hypothetical protein